MESLPHWYESHVCNIIIISYHVNLHVNILSMFFCKGQSIWQWLVQASIHPGTVLSPVNILTFQFWSWLYSLIVTCCDLWQTVLPTASTWARHIDCRHCTKHRYLLLMEILLWSFFLTGQFQVLSKIWHREQSVLTLTFWWCACSFQGGYKPVFHFVFSILQKIWGEVLQEVIDIFFFLYLLHSFVRFFPFLCMTVNN